MWLTLMFEGVTDLDVGQCEKLCVGLKSECGSQAATKQGRLSWKESGNEGKEMTLISVCFNYEK